MNNFAAGDFAAFIQPIRDTLALYHSHDVDPRAIAISINQLQTNHPEDDIEIVAVEKRGAEGVMTRLAVSPTADKPALAEEYQRGYDAYKALVAPEKAALEAELASANQWIVRQKDMINTLLARDTIVIQGNVRIATERGTMVEGDVGGMITTGDENEANVSK